MSKDILIKAFNAHISGNAYEAAEYYKLVIQADPENFIAKTLYATLQQQAVFARITQHSALNNLKMQGFLPGTVFDVGAQVGTPSLFHIFPDAHHVLLEPAIEWEEALKKLSQSLKSAEYHIKAVSAVSGVAILLKHPSLGAAQLVGADRSSEQGSRSVDCISLNDLISQKIYKQPFLVKIDVDGKEIEVLKGATALINKDTVFMIEATICDSDPRLPKIIDFFKPFDFVLHDMVDFLHRPKDGALWQCDVIMVHANSPYRAIKSFT